MASFIEGNPATKGLYGDLKRRMDGTVATFQANLASTRTGRASVHMLDQIKVEYYGEHMPINQLAQVSTPEAQLILISPYDPTVISQSRIIDIQHYAPNDRANLTVDYRLYKLVAAVHENFYGSYRDENDYPGQLFSSRYTTDIDVSYEVVHNVTAAVGGRNIFDQFPDRVAPSSTNTVYKTTGGLIDGEVYPRTGGPFGFNGAFFYARIDAKF